MPAKEKAYPSGTYSYSGTPTISAVGATNGTKTVTVDTETSPAESVAVMVTV